MIIKASERGGSNKLAKHLLNTVDNDQVEVHEVIGFMSSSLKSAMHEAYVISRGTKCTNFLFSVSFNPPEGENAPIAVFEDAINRAEERNGLIGQPRVIVFHEKEGRRHAHAVWSKIDTQKMIAINLPFYKNRLMEISKDLYLEQGWQLPKGFINKELRNPLNFTLEQWQQAKRLGDDPRIIKAALNECWSISKDKPTFINALKQHGYYLAKGDRRGYVAVDWRGKIYSLTKWLDAKAKDLKEKLGDKDKLLSVSETQKKIDTKLAERMNSLTGEVRQKYTEKLNALLKQKETLKIQHNQQRQELAQKQEQQWLNETKLRQARFRKGIGGLWDRLTRKHNHIKRQNEQETYQCFKRDQAEKNQLIEGQLQQRGKLQSDLKAINCQQKQEIQALKKQVFSHVHTENVTQCQQKINTSAIKINQIASYSI